MNHDGFDGLIRRKEIIGLFVFLKLIWALLHLNGDMLI
jgi:hypothetical protein